VAFRTGSTREKGRNISDLLRAVVLCCLGFVLGLLAAWLYWRRRVSERSETIRGLQTSLNERDSSLLNLTSRLREQEASVEHQRACDTKAGDATEPQRDNLERIEGIGPKISDVLGAAGVRTFAQLAATDVSSLEETIREVGIGLADPSTWPEQASLAASGQWSKLEVLQDELKGGRRV
jgi:predicted flap endonuclease-1-like 5' DNA nuclease